MKQFYVFLLLLLLFHQAISQQLKLQIGTGLTKLNVPEIEAYYQKVVNYYANHNIEMPTQAHHPISLLLTSSVGVRLFPNWTHAIYVGPGLYYTKTGRVNAYEDRHGIAEIRSSVNVMAPYIFFEYDYQLSDKLAVVIKPELWYGFLKNRIEETASFKVNQELDVESSFKGKDASLGYGMEVGAAYNLDIAKLNLSAGYRMLEYKRVHQTIESIKVIPYYEQPTPAFNFNLNGLFVIFSLSKDIVF